MEGTGVGISVPLGFWVIVSDLCPETSIPDRLNFTLHSTSVSVSLVLFQTGIQVPRWHPPSLYLSAANPWCGKVICVTLQSVEWFGMDHAFMCQDVNTYSVWSAKHQWTKKPVRHHE